MHSHENDINDIQLINALVESKPGAFETFYMRYNRLIYHIIKCKMHGKFFLEVDDVFQEFFAELQSKGFRQLHLWNRSSSFVSFLSTVVRNFTLDQIRKRISYKSSLEKINLQTTEFDNIDPSYNALDRLLHKALRRSGIKAWLNLKNPRDRRLICDKYHKNLSYDKISIREGLNNNATRQAVFNAQQKFMSNLKLMSPEYFPS